MRNKAKGFPYGNNHRFEGEPRAKPEYGSLRANGTINTNPQGRMRESGAREDNRNQPM
ncbi:small, acid-soluble spore protein K [Siminovitchia sediminis]|uniref:Small, acid-soluble spore protein K n=1 Tax=Siminovitchia sediminis TaxID=1274353 RepID=A0ABW4KKN9_9BACI